MSERFSFAFRAKKLDDVIRKWHNPTKQSNLFVSPKSKEEICLL